MELLLVSLGALGGLLTALSTERFRQRGSRDQLRDDLYRRLSGDFVGLATTARYEYERFASLRRANGVTSIPEAFDKADNDLAKAFHQLSFVADRQTLEAASRLRHHLEEMKIWVATADNANLGESAVQSRVETAWTLRDKYVASARAELGLEPARPSTRISQGSKRPTYSTQPQERNLSDEE